jgi:hypothetical protein
LIIDVVCENIMSIVSGVVDRNSCMCAAYACRTFCSAPRQYSHRT